VEKVSFYKAKSQELKTDGEGLSKYWSIRSKKMSFTYFEVPPHTQFKKHKHFSEQITYVINGQLFFGTEMETFCLEEGDSIVIASNVEHRVWTTDDGCTAVDAWAPANEKY
jgi:quercetin dioxygenase-like cupin family protein